MAAAQPLAAISKLCVSLPPASRKNRTLSHAPPSLKGSPQSISNSKSPKTIRSASALLLREHQTNLKGQVQILCQAGNLKEAIKLISQHSAQYHDLDSDTCCSLLQLCAELGSLPDGRKVHSIISSSGMEIDSALGSKLVFMYVKCGDLIEGRKVFDGIASQKHPFLWNLLLNEYTKAGDFEESVSLFELMWVSGIRPNSQTFSCILKCFAALGSLSGGERAHGYLLKLGFDDYIGVENALIAFYSKRKRINSAISLFGEMLERDVISWNSIISGCVSNGLSKKGVQLFAEMWFSGMDLDLVTLVSVLPACAETDFPELGRAIHAYSTKAGIDKEIMLSNSLLDMYSKCGNLENAMRIFEKLSQRTVVSWTSMISAYTRNGLYEEAIALFGTMESEGMKPDLYAITSVLHACASNKELDQGKHAHNYVVSNGLESNLFVANALMDMHAKCGNMEEARSIFDRTKDRDIISWNTLIGGYSKNCLPNEALYLFSEMLCHLKPNSVTMASILPAVASLSSLEKGREIHGHILRAGYPLDGYVANALVDMYAKCGALLLSRLLFDRLVNKDCISWTIMITAYGMHGHGTDAIAVFKEMRGKCIKPDGVSFIAILYACSHSGLINEGWRFFNIMRNEYNIEPELEHYACMVDLLSRAGHLIKAYKFIESMPLEPDSTVWGALLCGCRIHRDVKLAERVAERIFELEPENMGYYILLANVYAEAEKWEAVKKLREKISNRRLRKNPGCSWIEIRSKTHLFVAGDKSHPQSKKIELFLQEVTERIKDDGYVPKRRYALMNVDDMVKEEALCGHSEKLAIAFGILNSPKGKPIRVAKNLRVCGDCHEVAKFISKIFGREIILRDSNRFHHFQDGRCSCRGYW